ncbi:MAG TPA: LuxR C-terminal-related transcriptional regulator, partial [Chloroflexota bacterium]
DEHIGRDVAELCVRLDGLPLAIELAAARARLLRPRDMLARIARQIELLRSGDDRGARHQSLRAAVGWSYDLLSEAEQRAFRCLSVFAGGCSLDAAEAVLDQPGALDLLASLLDKSLVRNEPGQAGTSRLRQLETIRAFGLEQLADSGESDMVRARHAAYYLALARPESWDALDLPAADWLEMIAPEHDNLRAALRWSFDHDQRRLGLELATALQGFWMVSGYLREGLSWIEQAISHSEGAYPEVEAWARQAAGQLAWRQGNYDRAAQHYAAGVALRQARGDSFGVAIGRQGLASVARDRGDVREAIALWEECVAAFRQYQHQARTARASLNLAIALHLDGQSERAVTLLEESARVAGDIGQHWAQATSLTYLALIALEVHSDRSRAAAHVRAALPLVPRVSDAWVTTHLLELAAWLAAGSDQSASVAARLFGAADALRERIGARLHPAFAVGRERWLNELWQREDLDLPLAEGAVASLDDMLRLAMNVARELAHRPIQAADTVRDIRVLSVREREIAGLVAQGMTSRQIAALLILGERTVETHVDHIRAKLGVRSRAQIAAWAVEHGLAARDAQSASGMGNTGIR